MRTDVILTEVFPIVQSYKFKSKSQHTAEELFSPRGCFR